MGRLIIALVLAGVAAMATAQTATETPTPADGGAAPASAQALIDILRDDAARAALIDELERLADGAADTPDGAAGPPDGAADGEAEAGAAPDPAAEAASDAPEPVARSLGGRLAQTTQALAADVFDAGAEFWNALAATERRLSALYGARSGVLIAALIETAAIAAVAIGVFIAARFLAARLFPGPAPDATVTARVVNATMALALDALAIALAWAAGYVVAMTAFGETGVVQVNESLFLNAFLISQLCKLPLRAVLAPEEQRVRIAPLSDAAARSAFRQISLLIDFTAYSTLFIAPLVTQTVSLFTGRAVLTVANAASAVWAIVLVLRNRRAPGAWLAERDGDVDSAPKDTTDRLLRMAAAIWDWPALLWLSFLFVASVTRSGAVGPLVLGAASALAIAALGAFVGSALGRLARRGVRLPASLTETAPVLEPRINRILHRGLGLLRLVILAVTVAAALKVAGLFDIEAHIGAFLGPDFIGRLVSAGLVLAGATLVWLALASWVDIRLGGSNDAAASARARTLLTLLRNAVTVAIVLIAGMIALSELGLDIGPLIASAGVLGLAIGFGAQKLVQDVITGVFIQLENAINVGDVVTAGGVSGVAERLTIRSVSLRDLHGVVHVIPFSSVDMVSNFMKDFAFHVSDLGIAYREDVEDGKAAMHAAFDELKRDPTLGHDIIGELEWFGVNALGDSAVVLRARIRTRPGKQWGVGRAYNGLLKKHCDARGVEIPFPHMTVWFGENKDGSAPPARLAGDAVLLSERKAAE